MTANLLRCIIVALLIPFTFACTGLTIFVGNSADMPGSIPALVPLLCGLVGVVTLGLFLVQLPFLFIKKSWFVTINALLLGCGFLLWLQANVFNWNFGELDGSGVNWAAFRHLMALEIVVYVAVVGLVVWKRRRFSQYTVHCACLLMFMQAAPLAKPVAKELVSMRTKVAARHLLGFKTTPKMYEIARQEITPKCPDAEPTLDPNIPAWKQYDITFRRFFDYSPEQNVVLIVPDAFSSELFRRMMKKHPEVSEWFADFNYFLKQKSQAGTNVSIPQMLTGCDYDPVFRNNRTNPYEYSEAQFSVWNSEGALQKTLAEAGFRTRLYSWASTCHHWDHHWVYNIRLKKSTRDSLRVKTLGDDLIETGIGDVVDLAVVRSVPIICKPADIEHFSLLQRAIQAIGSTSTEFEYLSGNYDNDAKFVQIMNNNPVSTTSEKPVLNVIHIHGAHRMYNFNENFERESMNGIEGEERQALAALRLIKRLIDDMKEGEVYDNTLVIIAADHGNGIEAITCIADSAQFYNPLLMVKRQNERHDAMVCRTEYTNVQDITPTIMDLVGLTNPPGRFSIFDMPPDVLAERAPRYETFWAKRRKALKLQVVTLGKGDGGNVVSSTIALKRSDLHVKDGRLRWYVGDDPDVWNKTHTNHQAVILMNSTKKQSGTCYHGTARLHMNDDRGLTNYWSCMGTINIKNVADGEYTLDFLLPRQDGSYAGNTLPGTVTVAAGVASMP